MDPWLTALSTLAGLAALLLKQWQDRTQKAQERQDETNIQAERQALQENNGSIDAVAANQHDRVQRAISYSKRR